MYLYLDQIDGLIFTLLRRDYRRTVTKPCINCERKFFTKISKPEAK